MIASTLPAHNLHLFQARRATFQCRGATLNPNTLTVRDSPTRIHLSNLEKLLQTTPPSPTNPIHPPKPEPDASPPSPEPKPRGAPPLDLARIWAPLKPSEVSEMSPGHLNRLQRLLSMTPEYSPRSNLAGKWREYHGLNNWAGLLDPLDENLRREVVRYGEFIQSAYHSFNSDPAATPAGAPPREPPAVPDQAYRVTKSLYATCSLGLPKWVDDLAPDLGWMTQRSSWVGFVAVCDDKREIARMGRRDIVIALRGTATCLEWAENLRNVLVPLPEGNDSDQAQAQAQAKVECGFLSLHKTPGAHVPSLAQSVVEEVRRLVGLYEGEALSITVTGHSLGAALALLVADELTSAFSPESSPPLPPIAVFSFGGPRVGNRGFANRITSKNVKVLRIVNSQDVITRVPGVLVSEGLDRKLRDLGVDDRVVDAIDEWAYSHVGTELKVDTKMSPFLRPDADVACCHDLEAYLHLVDGFMASNCPFRANAKRSLVKLLHEQGSNVKKLYTSKAKALTLDVERDGPPIYGCLPSPS